MTAHKHHASSSTQRHAALRARLREKGYKRRTVWLSDVSLRQLDAIKDDQELTQDAAFAFALHQATMRTFRD